MKAIGDAFGARAHECAAKMATRLRRTLADVPGIAGINARYALRELVLRGAKDESHPTAARIALLRSITGSLDAKQPETRDLENKADARMLSIAAQAFAEDKDVPGQYDALWLAALVAQHQPIGSRDSPWIDVYLRHGGADAARQGQFARLARLLSAWNDYVGLSRVSRGVIRALHFNTVVWSEGDSAGIVAGRIASLLEVLQLLRDSGECHSCTSEWLWVPYLKSAIGYHRIGETEQADSMTNYAIELIRSIENPEQQIGALQSALQKLDIADYDHDLVAAVALEMKAFAESHPDGGTAQDVLRRWPRTVRRYDLEEVDK